MSVPENVAAVRHRIAEAARTAGRQSEEVTLMAVSKTASVKSIREAHAAGVRVFGENRVQEFSGKASQLVDLHDTEWHMIGHLQPNKAGRAAELFTAVDSLDSLRLAGKLNAAAQQFGTRLDLLIEVNVGGEAAKSGVAPDSAELQLVLQSAGEWGHLRFRGLMSVPPFSEDPEATRPYFRRLRELRDQIAARNLPRVEMNVLSMGMSHDFEVAIEEGSTCVRVGTAIFGARDKA